MKKTPKQAAESMKQQLANLEKVKKMTIRVGVIGAGARIYKGGKNVVEIATIHEFGSHDMNVPQRSFLRTPFFVNRDKLNKFINKQLIEVVEKGKPAEVAMDNIGVKAQTISQAAFDNEGYGFWAPLKPETIRRKKSSAILFDRGTMRNSITWQVKG